MATYCYKGRGAAFAFEPNGFCVLRKKIDVPDLIASPGKLALAATPTAGLSTFSGFVQSDILEVFEVPAGFNLTNMGVRVTTAEGATAAGDLGCASATQTHLLTADADGYMGTIDLNSAVTQVGLVSDAQLGVDNNQGVVYVTAGSIDMTFTTDDTYAAFIADVWAVGCMVF